MTWATAAGDGTRLALRVQPRAARSEVAGRYGEALKVRLAAPPVDGAANEALVRFLAEALRVPRTAVTLVSGPASRSKVVQVSGLSPQEVSALLGLPLETDPCSG